MRVLIAGAGVIGTVYGAHLGAAGHYVSVLRHPPRTDEIAARGLAERLRELTLIEDRDRLAADLQSSVVQRIFAAGLKLQGVLPLATEAEVRHRVESSVADLDDAIRLLRQVIFGLEHRLETLGLRQQVLHLCAGLSPVPEITFTGPVDDSVPGPAIDRLLEMLRMAFGLIEPGAAYTSVDVQAGETLVVTVTGTGPGQQSADGSRPDFSPLRGEASLAGTAIEIATVPGGTRLAWRLPVRSGSRLPD